MVTNDPKAMSFLLMNALVCVVMLDISIIVNVCAARTVRRAYTRCVVVGGWYYQQRFNLGIKWKVARRVLKVGNVLDVSCNGFKSLNDKISVTFSVTYTEWLSEFVAEWGTYIDYKFLIQSKNVHQELFVFLLWFCFSFHFRIHLWE